MLSKAEELSNFIDIFGVSVSFWVSLIVLFPNIRDSSLGSIGQKLRLSWYADLEKVEMRSPLD